MATTVEQQQPTAADSAHTISAFQRFYRGTLYQAIVLGLVSFTQPGIWDALNSLGAGGLATPALVNAANVITYGIMVITCPLFAIAGNRWDLKWVLVGGTIGFVPYFAALYANSVGDGAQQHWFLILGAVSCGVSAAALWVSEGAIAVGYPEPERRGIFIAIWMALNKIGSITGNSIQLATNMNADGRRQGSINSQTYLILIALSCTGFPLSLTLSKAKDLIRESSSSSNSIDSDTRKQTAKTDSFSLKAAFKDLWHTLQSKHVLILLPTFITVRWSATYQGMYLAEYFTVRGRVLAGFVSTLLGISATILWGILLDADGGKPRQQSGRKARISRRWLVCNVGWWSILAVYTAQWVLNLVMQRELQSPSKLYHDGMLSSSYGINDLSVAQTTLSTQQQKVVLDISDPGYVKAILAYCLYSFASNASVVWTYWILGTYDTHVNKLAYSTAILRASESFGFAISYGIGSSTRITLMTNLIVALSVFWIGVPFTTYAAWNVKDDDVSTFRREELNGPEEEEPLL